MGFLVFISEIVSEKLKKSLSGGSLTATFTFMLAN